MTSHYNAIQDVNTSSGAGRLVAVLSRVTSSLPPLPRPENMEPKYSLQCVIESCRNFCGKDLPPLQLKTVLRRQQDPLPIQCT